MGILEGKAVVVTGAGRGLGAAYARLAAAEGAKVVVNDLDADAVGQVVASIRDGGGQAFPCVADISSWDGAASLMSCCAGQFGRVDGLVNNAALFYLATPEEETPERLEALVRVNVLGAAYCGIHALRQMRKQGSGAIVNITSGAQSGYSSRAAYGASKGAVASLTYGWSADMAGSGVRVNAFSPLAAGHMGVVMAEYHAGRGEKGPAPVDIDATDNAPAVIYLLSDEAAGVTGQVLRLEGRRLALMTHPAQLSPPLERERWTLSAVREAFQSHFALRQQPVGMVDLELRPPS